MHREKTQAQLLLIALFIGVITIAILESKVLDLKNTTINVGQSKVSSQQVTTNGNLVYTNNQEQVSFSYPQNWVAGPFLAQVNNPSFVPLVSLNLQDRESAGFRDPLISVAVWKNPANLSGPDYNQKVGNGALGICSPSPCSQEVVVRLNGVLVEIKGLTTSDIGKYKLLQGQVMQGILNSLKKV